jgi:membrane-associated protein
VDLIAQFVDVFLHLDQHLNQWATTLGPWLYVVLFLIVFCETGLVVTPFLPGDSLLFAVGALASLDGSPIDLPQTALLLVAAAVLGDAANYSIGAYLGPAVFSSDRSRLFNKQHLVRTQLFYERHGGKTIFLARFVPIIRTFAPFVAGIGRMRYRYFATYNVTGAIAWVAVCMGAGALFGEIPIVKRNFELVVLGIIAISLIPVVTEFVRARREAARDAAGSEA